MLQPVRTGTPVSPTIEALYETYYPVILRYFSHHGASHEESEDLTQETFFKAWQALPTVHYDDLLSWLYCIAKHLAIDAVRKQKAREHSVPHCSLDGEEERYAGVCNQEENILTRISLVEALQRLPERYRRAVVFSAYGFSLPEIAELVNYSPKAMKTIVYRGRKALKQHYQEVQA